MAGYYDRHMPGTSQALVCLKAPSVVSEINDCVSEYTASTVSPGSSVSSRSLHTSRSNIVPHHYREQGSTSSSRSSNPSVYSSTSNRSLASSKSSRTSYSEAPHSSTSSSTSSGTPSLYTVSFSSRKSHAASSFSPSTSSRSSPSSKHHNSTSSPSYDSSLLAIYLTSLRTRDPTAVHQFLLSNERFRDFRPHLSAMEDDAFRWFSDNVRSKNRDLVRGIESGIASSAVERIVRHVGQEWDEWMPRGRRGGCVGDGWGLELGREGRGRKRPGLQRRVSEVSYEEVWVQDGRTYRQRFSVTE